MTSAGDPFSLIPWDFDKTFWYPEPNFWSDNAPNGKNVVPNLPKFQGNLRLMMSGLITE